MVEGHPGFGKVAEATKAPVLLTKHEAQIMREIAGLAPASPWGAWVGALMESLRGYKLVDRRWQLTEAGKKWLEERK